MTQSVYGVSSREFSSELVQPVAAIPFEVTGVDVSYWQGDINWAIMATRAQFAFIRAGSGNAYIDGKLAQNVAGAKDNGIPYGLYWYIKPDKSWQATADAFSNAVSQYGGALYPVFDIEESGGLSKAELDSFIGKLISRFRANLGLNLEECATYTSPGFLNRAMPMTAYLKWTHLWVAHWTTAPEPLRPNEWLIPDKPWKFWQYSAKGDGKAHGAQSTYIDLNRYNGTAEQFANEFGSAPPPPPPPPPPPTQRRVKVDKVSSYLNVRDTPNGVDQGELYRNSVVPVIDEDGEWLRIDGWIHGGYVSDV